MSQLNNWLSIDKTSGTGNAQITLSASSYEELVERTATIKLQGINTNAILTVRQKALVPTIKFSESSLYFPYNGEYTSITLTSNVKWQMRKSDSWIYVSHEYGDKGETTFGIEVFENEGETKSGKIEFLFNGEVIATLNITQFGLQSFEKSIMSFGCLAETQTNKVLTTVPWYFVTDGDWFSVTPTNGNGVSTISVRVNNNEGRRRIGIISLFSTNGDFFLGEIVVRQASEYDERYMWIETYSDGARVDTGKNVKYSYDGLNWETASAFNMGTNRLVYIKGDENFEVSPTSHYTISCDRQYSVGGKASALTTKLPSLFAGEYRTPNIYLIDASDLDISDLYIGYEMFGYCTKLVHPPKTLPSENLGTYGYMFRGCESLVESPLLPATKVWGYFSDYDSGTYSYMFSGCKSLTTPPQLPATEIGMYCYYAMFQDCTSLTTAPALPATIMQQGCYTNMFNGCTSLITTPELPATDLSHSYNPNLTTPAGCYGFMFQNCTSLTTAPELPATTLGRTCYEGMFGGCYNLTTAPVLPATTLVYGCYGGMFSGCSKLNYIKMLATDISADYCLDWWVMNVAPTGTFVKHPNADLPRGEDGIPYRWTVETATK